MAKLITMKSRKAIDAEKPSAAEIDREVLGKSPAAAVKRTRVRFILNVHPETVERLRNVAWTDREAASGIAEAAILAELDRREKRRGSPYPPRGGELRAGRKSTR